MKKVMISISGLQSMEPEESDNVEFVTEGEYDYGDPIQFEYMESELTGLEGTLTHFTVEPDQVILNRTGTMDSQMIFKKGGKQFFMYNTLFGHFTMGLETHSIEKHFTPTGGEMNIRYVVDMDQATRNRNVLHITINEI